MIGWIRRHERMLWWAVLLASVVVGVIRQPHCATATPWWAWVAPVAVFLLMFSALLWMRWTMRRPR